MTALRKSTSAESLFFALANSIPPFRSGAHARYRRSSMSALQPGAKTAARRNAVSAPTTLSWYRYIWARLYHAPAFLSCLSFVTASRSVCSPSCKPRLRASGVSLSSAAFNEATARLTLD